MFDFWQRERGSLFILTQEPTNSDMVCLLSFLQWENGGSVVVRVQRDYILTHILGFSGSSHASNLIYHLTM